MKHWGGRRAAALRRRIVEIYGSTCHLCQEPIDLSLSFPHPLSLTADHLVPQARGGSHSLENLRPAHLTCNSSRQDTPLTAPNVVDNRRFFMM